MGDTTSPEVGAVVGVFIVLYIIARIMGLIPLPLVPYMDAIAGILVVITLPFLPWYGGFPLGLVMMVISIGRTLRELICGLGREIRRKVKGWEYGY
jgi:hypothetical protein